MDPTRTSTPWRREEWRAVVIPVRGLREDPSSRAEFQDAAPSEVVNEPAKCANVTSSLLGWRVT
jgi:hypothetical protein